MDPITALSQTYDHMEGTAKGVSADQLTNPSPCSEWDVRALLDHAFNVVSGIGAATAGREPQPVALDEANLGGQFRSLADESLGAWRADGVLDREINGAAGPMPGAQYATINMLDTLVHAWDLAKATGQDTTIPESLAAHCLAACQGFITPEIRQFAGFDAVVEVPATASTTDKLAAFMGRRP